MRNNITRLSRWLGLNVVSSDMLAVLIVLTAFVGSLITLALLGKL